MLKKHQLLSPGPTPIPEKVLSAAAEPIIHHRTPEFSAILMETMAGLKQVFQTEQDVFILTSSGSGAMEAAVVNTLSPGDSVLSINGGKFGGRWSQICQAYGVNVNEIKLEWGQTYSKNELSEELHSAPDIKAILTTLSETSTGTIFDIKGYSEIVSLTDAILVVDGISGVGAVPCPMDEWQIDVLISGSQKSFMTPPGLAYMAFSPKAWKHIENSRLPRFYFDAQAAKDSLKKQTTPWTPAISLIIQQKRALEIILAIGLEEMIEHHRVLGDATRAGVISIGLELLSQNPGNVLTAVKVPNGLDGVELVRIIQEKYHVFIAGAQDSHKGKFFRIGHLGYIGGFDIITALSALEMALSELNHKFEKGNSLKAGNDILKESWQ